MWFLETCLCTLCVMIYALIWMGLSVWWNFGPRVHGWAWNYEKGWRRTIRKLIPMSKSYLSLALFMHVYFWECVWILISVWRYEMTEERRGLTQGRKGEFSQNLIHRLAAHDLPLGYSWNFQLGNGQHWIS